MYKKVFSTDIKSRGWQSQKTSATNTQHYWYEEILPVL